MLASIGQTARLGGIRKGSRRFACSTCAKGFASLKSLESHALNNGHVSASFLPANWRKNIDGTVPADGDTPGKPRLLASSIRVYNHHCELCGLGFRNWSQMKRHRRQGHEGMAGSVKANAHLMNHTNQIGRVLNQDEQKMAMVSLPQWCHSRGELADQGYRFDSKSGEASQECHRCYSKCPEYRRLALLHKRDALMLKHRKSCRE